MQYAIWIAYLIVLHVLALYGLAMAFIQWIDSKPDSRGRKW